MHRAPELSRRQGLRLLGATSRWHARARCPTTVGRRRTDHAPDRTSPLNVWATITGLDLLGYRVRAQINGQPDALVDLTPTAVADLGLRPGQPAWLSANPTEVDVHPLTEPTPNDGRARATP